MGKLSQKQEKFANLYVDLGNASEAYRRSYPNSKKWKDSTIWTRASEMLADKRVAERVKEIQAELREKASITKQEAVRELTNIVRGRIIDVFEFTNGIIKIKDLSKLPDEIVSCISSIKETSTGTEIKLYDKIQAIDRLSRMMGWDEAEKHEIEGQLKGIEIKIIDDQGDKDE